MEVVEGDNAVPVDELARQGGAYEAGATGNEDSLACERHAATVTAMKSAEPIVSPPAIRIQTPALPKWVKTGPAATRPTGLPRPVAVITAVITFARSAAGGRVESSPMIGALTIGTKIPQSATAAKATGQETGAAITQSGAVASTMATQARRNGANRSSS